MTLKNVWTTFAVVTTEDSNEAIHDKNYNKHGSCLSFK